MAENGEQEFEIQPRIQNIHWSYVKTKGDTKIYKRHKDV